MFEGSIYLLVCMQTLHSSYRYRGAHVLAHTHMSTCVYFTNSMYLIFHILRLGIYSKCFDIQMQAYIHVYKSRAQGGVIQTHRLDCRWYGDGTGFSPSALAVSPRCPTVQCSLGSGD